MDSDNTRKRSLDLVFDLARLQDLGSLVYPSPESALLELIARSYEAGATVVDIRVTLSQTGSHTVTLEDDAGMSDDQLGKLVDIGSPLAENPNPHRVWCTSEPRKYGNLACFAIGKSIELTTCEKGSGTVSCITVDLEALEKQDRPHRGVCTPNVSQSKCEKERGGTKIAIAKISPRTGLDVVTLDRLTAHLAQRLIFADPNFVVKMSVNGTCRTPVSNNFWRDAPTKPMTLTFPDKNLLPGLVYRRSNQIAGFVLVSPESSIHSFEGIQLIANRQVVSEPEFFGARVPENFTSRTAGFLYVDFISGYTGALRPGNSPTINWEHPEMQALRGGLNLAVHNIYSRWIRQCEEATSWMLGEEIGSEWFQALPFAKQSDLLVSLLSAEGHEKGRIIDHALSIIGKLMSPRPKRQWRELHGDITSNSTIMDRYESGDYYGAVDECIMVYCEKIREIADASSSTESTLMGTVFGNTTKESGKIVLSTILDRTSSENIQKGHRHLSLGLIYGFKNPAGSHGSKTKMMKHGLFTEDDCLDILSLVSYLFRCVENREYPPPRK